MNKKELNEIKKQLKYENETLYLKGIQEGYGRCNDGEPVVRFTRLIHGDTLEKEEGELFFDIFKKSLSGTYGKNLIEYGFDHSVPESKALQETFFAYKNGSLLIKEEFEQLVKDLLVKGDYRNPVYITAGIFEYAAPALNKNNEILEENSVFRFMIVAISEAKLTEIGLFYNHETNEVQRKVNDEMQIVTPPLDAFLYPSFSGRASDVNHFLYHAKSAKKPNIDLIEDYFHIPFVSSAPEQAEGFAKVIADIFPNGMDTKTALKFHENLANYINENDNEDSMVMMDKTRIKDLLVASGAPDENMRFFDSSFSKILEDQEVAAVNLMETGKVSFKAPSISISIRDDALEFVRTKTIDGRPCLVIEMNDGLEISGLPANLLTPAKAIRVLPTQDKQEADAQPLLESDTNSTF